MKKEKEDRSWFPEARSRGVLQYALNDLYKIVGQASRLSLYAKRYPLYAILYTQYAIRNKKEVDNVDVKGKEYS